MPRHSCSSNNMAPVWLSPLRPSPPHDIPNLQIKLVLQGPRGAFALQVRGLKGSMKRRDLVATELKTILGSHIPHRPQDEYLKTLNPASKLLPAGDHWHDI